MGIPVLTAAEMREAERGATAYGVSLFALMENACKASANWLLAHLRAQEYCVLCGKGNNGGDGYGIAVRLAQQGKRVQILTLCGAPTTDDAQTMAHRASQAQIPVLSSDSPEAERALAQAECIVDAIYGIGFRGELPEAVRKCFRTANAQAVPRIAVDLPSGVCCDTAQVAADAFRADVTLTFSAYKPAQLHTPGELCCGRTIGLSIGIPPEAISAGHCREWITEESDVRHSLPLRPLHSHKGTFGKALCVCGSYGMAGAASFAAAGALRSGAGLVQLAVPESIYPILAGRLPEPIMLPLPEVCPGTLAEAATERVLSAAETAQAVLFGCGVGIGEMQERLLLSLLRSLKQPLVLDADGINLLAKHKDAWKTASCQTVITPHPGEMARLCACSIAEIEANRLQYARTAAQEYRTVVLLKGHHTVIAAPDGEVWVNPTGNAGMAKGGSGDLLAGMVVSLLAQHIAPLEAAKAVAWLHGKAGDLCAETKSQTAMLPSDVAEMLPKLFLKLERREEMRFEKMLDTPAGYGMDDRLYQG